MHLRLILLGAIVLCAFNGIFSVKDLPLLYKSNAILYCDDFDDANNDGLDDGVWKDVSFYKSVRVNESFYTIYKIVPDGDKFEFNEETSTLTIYNLLRSDMIDVTYLCNSSITKKYVIFHSQVKPFLYVPIFESVTVMEGSDAEISCNLLYGLEGAEQITWEWEEDGIDLVPDQYTIIENSESGNSSTLKLKEVVEARRGVYRCSAKNSYGVATQDIILRVKNRWDFIYPTIGIVVVLLITVLIIYFCEKKNNKKIEKDFPKRL